MLVPYPERNWPKMAGSNNTEKHINGFLTAFFVARRCAPADECLRYAKAATEWWPTRDTDGAFKRRFAEELYRAFSPTGAEVVGGGTRDQVPDTLPETFEIAAERCAEILTDMET